LRRALNFSASKDTVLHLLNRSVRRGRDECSATVDLFELDLYTKDAVFIKSGCAPSYVKRDTSLFRIKSQTAPIGLMSTIDTEKIRVEVQDGDIIVMLSDGISQTSDDAPWLLEFLSRPIKKDSLKDYADKILALAKEKSKSGDDMSVAVLKIIELN
jgi:stage II sporulation protein E